MDEDIIWQIDIEKIAVALLWLRPIQVGGTETYSRNLPDDFRRLEESSS